MKVKLFITFSLALFMVACGGISPELEQTSGTENGHEYVDLGLSVMWAPYNVGAAAIDEYGDLFAWGEVETKDFFGTDNYIHGRNLRSRMFYTKYCFNSSDGNIDNLTTLEPEDDAAHVQWGGTWRLPTEEEWNELRTNCTWTRKRENGKKGWQAKGPNGKSVFFPLAGWQIWKVHDDINSSGSYRSSTLSPEYSSATYIALFDWGDGDEDPDVYWSYGSRETGASIRPVCVPKSK